MGVPDRLGHERHPIQSVSPSQTPSLEKSRYLVPTRAWRWRPPWSDLERPAPATCILRPAESPSSHRRSCFCLPARLHLLPGPGAAGRCAAAWLAASLAGRLAARSSPSLHALLPCPPASLVPNCADGCSGQTGPITWGRIYLLGFFQVPACLAADDRASCPRSLPPASQRPSTPASSLAGRSRLHPLLAPATSCVVHPPCSRSSTREEPAEHEQNVPCIVVVVHDGPKTPKWASAH